MTQIVRLVEQGEMEFDEMWLVAAVKDRRWVASGDRENGYLLYLVSVGRRVQMSRVISITAVRGCH